MRNIIDKSFWTWQGTSRLFYLSLSAIHLHPVASATYRKEFSFMAYLKKAIDPQSLEGIRRDTVQHPSGGDAGGAVDLHTLARGKRSGRYNLLFYFQGNIVHKERWKTRPLIKAHPQFRDTLRYRKLIDNFFPLVGFRHLGQGE